MLQRFKVIGIVTAWFLATGGQWDLVQVIAWARMFAGHAEEMTFSAAAKKTFSGEMCGLCHIAQDGRQQQESNGDQLPQGKIPGKALDICLLDTATVVFTPHRKEVGTVVEVPNGNGLERRSPPTPPPRV